MSLVAHAEVVMTSDCGLDWECPTAVLVAETAVLHCCPFSWTPTGIDRKRVGPSCDLRGGPWVGEFRGHLVPFAAIELTAQ